MYKIALLSLMLTVNAWAAELTADTPGIKAIERSMHARHAQLLPYYENGAVGFSLNGDIELHDVVPMNSRQKVNSLIAAENRDREALYAEIANANAHPEWKAEIRSVFARRWIKQAKPGWWVVGSNGWKQK